MRREWAPGTKRLTWHLSCYGGRASHCDNRIEILASDVRTALTADGPSGVDVCRRCQRIARHLNAASSHSDPLKEASI